MIFSKSSLGLRNLNANINTLSKTVLHHNNYYIICYKIYNQPAHIQLNPTRLRGCKQVQQILGKLEYLRSAQFRLSIDAIDERNRYLSEAVVQLPSPHNHFHLEDVALGFAAGNELLQHFLLVQPEGTGQIRRFRSEQHLRQKVGSPGDELPLEVPSIDTSVAQVAGTGNDVVVGFLLEVDKFRNEFGLEWYFSWIRNTF